MATIQSKCKRCRRAGEKLFLKGERCSTPKCAMVRKPYAPGFHGGKRGGRPARRSEYGTQLNEKQKLRFLYGVSESQFSTYVAKALANKSQDVGSSLVQSLESRLDNVVFRLGFAVSRSLARQMVSHGHVLVNGKRVTIASFTVKNNDEVKLTDSVGSSALGTHLEITLKKHEAPVWLQLNAKEKSGKCVAAPVVDEMMTTYNVRAIIEFYSR